MKRVLYATIISIGMGVALFEFIQYKNEDPNIEWYKEANAFKYECLIHQDSLINLQYSLIEDLYNDSLNTKDIEKHKSLIKEQQEILDSLYLSEL